MSWIQAAEVLAITARQLRRIRRIERHGMPAVMDQRGGRPRRKRIKAGTVQLLIRLKRDVYGDFSVRHFYEPVTAKHGVQVSYNWLRLMLQEAGAVAKESARGQYRRRRERRPMVGMPVHLDASTHEWIAGLPSQDLVVALDDGACPRRGMAASCMPGFSLRKERPKSATQEPPQRSIGPGFVPPFLEGKGVRGIGREQAFFKFPLPRTAGKSQP